MSVFAHRSGVVQCGDITDSSLAKEFFINTAHTTLRQDPSQIISADRSAQLAIDGTDFLPIEDV